MSVDWHTMFVPSLAPIEIVVRGTIIYLGLFLLLRLVLKRAAGAIGMTDLLLIVLVADAAQNAMAGEYKSITDGALLIGTIAFWNWFLDWLGYHVPAVARLVHPAPRALVQDGALVRRNMRQEMVSEEELWSVLREHGVSELSDVRLAQVEGDGQISVLTRQPSDDESKGPDKRRAI